MVSKVSNETFCVYPAEGERCECDALLLCDSRAGGGSGRLGRGGGEVVGEVGVDGEFECFRADRKGLGENAPDIMRSSVLDES